MEHLLCEHIGGFELFELKGFEDLNKSSYADYLALTQIASHISSLPFTNSEEVLAQMAALQDGTISETLKNFLQLNDVKILHCDKSLKSELKNIGIEHRCSPNIQRGIRLNLKKFIKKEDNKQLTLSVSHSCAKNTIKYNLEREDNVVINTGYEVEHLESEIELLKDKSIKLINWYFPSISQHIKDNCELVLKILNKDIEGIDSSIMHKAILESVILEVDKLPEDEKIILLENLNMIREKQALLKTLEEYLAEKMKALAPNLREILGDRLGFKMIHKAGGLLNLALYPSSTLQLLGAEKSLFRSLKMRKNTPKYGLLYNLEYIKEDVGRMSRSVASKCSLASRIDYFDENRSGEYGKELKKMIEKRIRSLKKAPETTADVLERVSKRLKKNSETDSHKQKTVFEIEDKTNKKENNLTNEKNSVKASSAKTEFKKANDSKNHNKKYFRNESYTRDNSEKGPYGNDNRNRSKNNFSKDDQSKFPTKQSNDRNYKGKRENRNN